MRAGLLSLGITLLATLWGCSDTNLEVRGSLDRVVGETVTLSLVEGESGFSGEVELVAADQTPFSSAALKIQQIDDHKLTFIVPPGIAAGRAVAKAARADEAGTYDIPLTISRLAMAVTSTGVVEVLPLPPTVLKSSVLQDVDATGGHLALTASGGEVAVMAQDQINVIPLGASDNTFPGIQQKSGRAIAAIPGGVVICTDTAVFRFKHDQGETTKTDLLLPDCSAIAVSADGTKAVVLSACDSDNDGAKEDCLTELKLESSITKGAQVSLDATPSASMVSLRQDGMGAVVPDTKEIYGVWFDTSGTPVVTNVTWAPLATPAGISRGDSSLGDLFAVADSSSGRIRFVAFDTSAGNTLKPVSSLDLKEIPTSLDFGRRAELFVAAGTKLYRINAQVQQPKAEALEITASSEIGALLVQP